MYDLWDFGTFRTYKQKGTEPSLVWLQMKTQTKI